MNGVDGQIVQQYWSDFTWHGTLMFVQHHHDVDIVTMTSPNGEVQHWHLSWCWVTSCAILVNGSYWDWIPSNVRGVQLILYFLCSVIWAYFEFKYIFMWWKFGWFCMNVHLSSSGQRLIQMFELINSWFRQGKLFLGCWRFSLLQQHRHLYSMV